MEKTIYVITEYGVCDEHYHATRAYSTLEEADKAWEVVMSEMKAQAEEYELIIEEWTRGDWREAEIYDEDDSLGDFHHATLETMTINV